jgi:hypothetical protein
MQIRNSLFSAMMVLVGLLFAQGSAGDQERSGGDASAATGRIWTDDTGQHRTRATLIDFDQKAVVLRTEAGQQITVPLTRLSIEDQQYVRQQSQDPIEFLPEQMQLRYVNPMQLVVRVGVEITANQGACHQIIATFPLPMSWPEQHVEILDEDVSPGVQRVTTRTLNEGVRQVEFRIPRLVAGQSAHVIYTLQIKRYHILPPEKPHALRFASPVARELRPYLAESPYIEIAHPRVKAAVAEIPLDASQSAWQQVETIYDWTRARISHYEGVRPLQGALRGLETGSGDCEEITSLFVAMCRLRGIPARSVWVEGHTYPEFYLEDAKGIGVWIPCESLGDRVFGGMPSYRLLLQKGDRFTMAQKRGPQRYVTPTISGTVDRDGAQPILREILEQEEIQELR